MVSEGRLTSNDGEDLPIEKEVVGWWGAEAQNQKSNAIWEVGWNMP